MRKKQAILFVAGLTTLVSILVMIAWVFDFREVLSIIPDGATMKFNTALSFLLVGLSLFLSLPKWESYAMLKIIPLAGILGISGITLLQYLLGIGLGIDTLFVDDLYTISLPGRMSPATAFCFFLLGLGFIGIDAGRKQIKQATQYALLIVTLIALVAIVAYVLQIPRESKALFLNSMAIHTSFFFLLVSYAASLKNHTLGFTGLLLGRHSGSKLMQWLLPFIIFIPFILSYFLLILVEKEWLDIDFGIAIHTVTFILISIIYISVISLSLNKNDIKRKELELSLRDTNQELSFFKQALDASSIVAITDKKGVLTYVNDIFCQISKYDREELIGKTHRVINSGHHPRAFFIDLWKTISSGNVWVGDIKNRAKDGSYYWVHTSIIPFKNEAGRIYQYLAIRQDITKRKEAEALLSSQYVKKLEQKNKELEQFAYIASHDLQEPLRTVMNSVQLLETEYASQLDKTANKCLLFMDEASKRMSNLIKGLLDYSRIGQEKELAQINCIEMLGEIRQDLATIIMETGTTFTIHELPQISGYNVEIRLLFQNLISNAIKFRKKDLPAHIEIGAKKEQGYWKFSFKDNGIGIADEHKKKIFLIFQRLHKKSKFQGTGIGLAHCQKIVAIHGGSIWVDSELEKGSTFYFTIPIEIDEKKTELHLVN